MVKLNLYSKKLDEVHPQGGLNWGHSDGHVCLNDAYIALPAKLFRDEPNFFPAHGSVINAVWDDGEEMTLSLEGTQEINGVVYPKQISTDADKSILGEYIRERLSIPSEDIITRDDLKKYGREDVDVTYDEDDDIFIFNFHV